MSLHRQNAIAAAANHTAYFAGDAAAAQYRETDACKWVPIADAVIHGERIAYETRGSGATMQRVRVIRREIYLPGNTAAYRIHGQIRITECGTVYTVIAVAERSGRVQLTLQGAAIREVTRPAYRPV
jgi:allantoicase